MNLIEEVLRLDKEATQGPWSTFGPYTEGGYLDSGYVVCERGAHEPDPEVGDLCGSEPLHGYSHGFSDEDASLIALYRTAAPKLARALMVAMEKIDAFTWYDHVAEKDAKEALDEIEKELMP